jgi:hypothetical protein
MLFLYKDDIFPFYQLNVALKLLIGTLLSGLSLRVPLGRWLLFWMLKTVIVCGRTQLHNFEEPDEQDALYSNHVWDTMIRPSNSISFFSRSLRILFSTWSFSIRFKAWSNFFFISWFSLENRLHLYLFHFFLYFFPVILDPLVTI